VVGEASCGDATIVDEDEVKYSERRFSYFISLEELIAYISFDFVGVLRLN